MLKTAVCTFHEGDYHLGVGVLANSLCSHGFRGTIWVGYRGYLPPWAEPIESHPKYQEYCISNDCVIRFVKLDTLRHFSNYKPDFMLEILETYDPEIESLFYIDPDIVNKCSWEFYQEWVSRGIALCEDAYDYMPVNHPYRLAWKEFAEQHGYTCHRELDRYYNSGFIGVKREHRSILELWLALLRTLESKGFATLEDFRFLPGYKYPHLMSDQCVMNLAVMITPHPLSTVGRIGMDFGGATFDLMSHASGAQIKPWRKKYILKALNGIPPTLTDKAYWQNAQTPIPVYSKLYYWWKRLDLRCGAAIGRFIRRT